MLVNKLKNYREILSIFTCVLAGLFSNTSFAFTLGDIRLDSALNQPLSANIELLELDGLDESQILVTLGSEADFDRVGVEPLPLLNELEFEVVVLSNSEGLVRISSADAIVEPYLNFVLNVRWPSGRVIREYTVLLDLPTFSANLTPATAPEPARTAPPPRPEPEPVQQQVAENPDVEPSSETVVIQSGDSLWNIALATRPGNDVSVQQMMLTIQRVNTNSDAFIGNNINGIRTGRVLRIPSRQEINAISQDQALIQVAVQNQQFSNNAQPLAVNSSRRGTITSRDELSIVNSVNDAAESAEIVDLNATITNLENDLTFSEESLDRALIENEELRSRLGDLEEEIAILENIIAIEGQRMAELQAELSEQAEVAATEVLAIVAPQDTTTPAPTPEPTQPTAGPEPTTGIIGQISNLVGSTLGMVAALGVLLALVVGFLIARNRSAATEEDDFDAILAEEENEPSFAASSEDSNEETIIAEDDVAEEITKESDDGLEQGDFDQADLSKPEEDEASAVSEEDELSDDDIKIDLDDVEDSEDSSSSIDFVDDPPPEPIAEDGAGSNTEEKSEADEVFEFNLEDEDKDKDKDEDEDEDSGEDKEASSSLGNLGLDDAIVLDESDEEELEVITDQDEVSTKLDLAVAYQAMDDVAGAKEILNEVIAEGNETQIAEAQRLLAEWGDS